MALAEKKNELRESDVSDTVALQKVHKERACSLDTKSPKIVLACVHERPPETIISLAKVPSSVFALWARDQTKVTSYVRN